MEDQITEVGNALRSILLVEEEDLAAWQAAAMKALATAPAVKQIKAEAPRDPEGLAACIRSLSSCGEALYREHTLLDSLRLESPQKVGADFMNQHVMELLGAWSAHREILKTEVFRLKLIFSPTEERMERYASWRQRHYDREDSIRDKMEDLVDAEAALGGSDANTIPAQVNRAVLTFMQGAFDLAADILEHSGSQQELEKLDGVVDSWCTGLPQIERQREIPSVEVCRFERDQMTLKSEHELCWRQLEQAPDMFRSEKDLEFVKAAIGGKFEPTPLLAVTAGNALRPLKNAVAAVQTVHKEIESIRAKQAEQAGYSTVNSDASSAEFATAQPPEDLASKYHASVQQLHEARETVIRRMYLRQYSGTHREAKNILEAASCLLHEAGSSLETEGARKSPGSTAPTVFDAATAVFRHGWFLTRRIPWLDEYNPESRPESRGEDTLTTPDRISHADAGTAKSTSSSLPRQNFTVPQEVASRFRDYLERYSDIEKILPKPAPSGHKEGGKEVASCTTFPSLWQTRKQSGYNTDQLPPYSSLRSLEYRLSPPPDSAQGSAPDDPTSTNTFSRSDAGSRDSGRHDSHSQASDPNTDQVSLRTFDSVSGRMQPSRTEPPPRDMSRPSMESLTFQDPPPSPPDDSSQMSTESDH